MYIYTFVLVYASSVSVGPGVTGGCYFQTPLHIKVNIYVYIIYNIYNLYFPNNSYQIRMFKLIIKYKINIYKTDIIKQQITIQS